MPKKGYASTEKERREHGVSSLDFYVKGREDYQKSGKRKGRFDKGLKGVELEIHRLEKALRLTPSAKEKAKIRKQINKLELKASGI